MTMGVLLLMSGLFALGAATGAFDVGLDTALAAGLLVVGLALVLGAWFGHARWLILLGVLLTLLLATATFVDVPLEGGVGDREYRPRRIADVEDEYRLLAGSMLLDLSQVSFERTTEVEASVAAGELRVVVPADVEVDIDVHVDVGEAQLFQSIDNGFDIDSEFTGGGSGRSGRLVLRLESGAGRVEVDRAAA
jgi:hypothetical protein